MIWTIILEYNHPMPFIGMLGYYIPKILSIVVYSIVKPIGYAPVTECRRKVKYFMFYELIYSNCIFTSSLLSTIFTKLEKSDLQWIIAILLPIFKECFKFSLAKVMHKLVGKNNEKANVALGIRVNVSFGVFVATRLPGARSITVICITASDFLMQLFMSFQIIQLYKNVASGESEEIDSDKQKAVIKLALAEISEGLVPLAYALCFAMAYYGPNAKLIGNIGIELWAYKAVNDVNWTFGVLFGLFFLDLISFFLNGFIIWTYCKVNIVLEICNILHKYWYIIAVMLANYIFLYFISNDINFGNDWTFNFCWILRNDKFKLTCNSSNLSLDKL